jgi:hypothetical protein
LKVEEVRLKDMFKDIPDYHSMGVVTGSFGETRRTKSNYSTNMDKYRKKIKKILYNCALIRIDNVIDRILSIPNINLSQLLDNKIQIVNQTHLYNLIEASNIVDMREINDCKILIANLINNGSNRSLSFNNELVMDELTFYACVVRRKDAAGLIDASEKKKTKKRKINQGLSTPRKKSKSSGSAYIKYLNKTMEIDENEVIDNDNNESGELTEDNLLTEDNIVTTNIVNKNTSNDNINNTNNINSISNIDNATTIVTTSNDNINNTNNINSISNIDNATTIVTTSNDNINNTNNINSISNIDNATTIVTTSNNNINNTSNNINSISNIDNTIANNSDAIDNTENVLDNFTNEDSIVDVNTVDSNTTIIITKTDSIGNNVAENINSKINNTVIINKDNINDTVLETSSKKRKSLLESTSSSSENYGVTQINEKYYDFLYLNSDNIFINFSNIFQKIYNYNYSDQYLELNIVNDDTLTNIVIQYLINPRLHVKDINNLSHWIFKISYYDDYYNLTHGNGLCMVNAHYQILSIQNTTNNSTAFHKKVTMLKNEESIKEYTNILKKEKKDLKQNTLRNLDNQNAIQNYETHLDESIKLLEQKKTNIPSILWGDNTTAGIPFFFNAYNQIIEKGITDKVVPPIEKFPILNVYESVETTTSNPHGKSHMVALISTQPNSCKLNNINTIDKTNPILYTGNFTLPTIESAIINRDYSITLGANHFFQTKTIVDHNRFQLARIKCVNDINNYLKQLNNICLNNSMNTIEEIEACVKSAIYFCRNSNNVEQNVVFDKVNINYGKCELGN